jgi:SAM-dependent methyltransferase
MQKDRERLKKYLSGNGIEIGALQNPMDLAGLDVSVKYVDRCSAEELREHYPELKTMNLVSPDIIADAHSLVGIKDNSLDFIIANHLLEHLANPIEALQNWQQKLRPGGVIFLALPDKRYTFDKERALTTTEHVMSDFKLSAAERAPLDKEHYLDWAQHVNGKKGGEREARAQELIDMEYAIHFHVWTDETFGKLLNSILSQHLQELEILDQADTNPAEKEFIFIIKKKGINTSVKASFLSKIKSFFSKG